MLRYASIAFSTLAFALGASAQEVQRVHVLYPDAIISAAQLKYLTEATKRVDPDAVISMRPTSVYVSTDPWVETHTLLDAFNNTPGAGFSATPGLSLAGTEKQAPPPSPADPNEIGAYNAAKAAWLEQKAIDPADPNTLIHP